MTKIIRAELYKYSKSIITKVMILVGIGYAFIQCVSLIALLYVNIGAINDDQVNLIKGYQAFAAADMASIFTFFVPFMVVFSFTSEFSKKTFGNLLGYNVSKQQLFISKYVAFCIIVIAVSIILALTSTVIAMCANGWGIDFHVSQIVDILMLILRVSLVQIASASLMIIISLYLHNDAAIVILYFVLSLIESIITAFVSRIEVSNIVLRFLISSMPSNCVDGFQMMIVNESTIVCGLFYTLSSMSLCIFLGSWIINRRDIIY